MTHGRRQVEEYDREQPVDYVRRALLGGHAHPWQSHDEQDLRQREVDDAEVFLEIGLAGLDGVRLDGGHGAVGL
jgi:hypothetical protein